MIKKNFKNILVGSGPIAAGFISSHKIPNDFLIIDTDIQYENKISTEYSKDQLYKIHDIKNKTYFGNSDATLKNLFSNNLKFKITNSFMKGGLSNIWGAAIKKYTIKEILKIGLNKEIVKEKIHAFDLKITNNKNFNKKEIKLYKNIKSKYVNFSTLAINSESCNQCGKCMYGCHAESIYNSNINFDSKVKEKKIKVLKKYYLHKIKKINDEYILELNEISNKSKKFIKCKNLILACGPINNATILLNSFDNIKFIDIKDSSCFYYPIVSKIISFHKKIDKNIELSWLYIINKINNLNLHSQIYKPLFFIKNQIQKKIKIKSSFLDRILSNFFLVQSYLPSSKSSTGRFYKEKDNQLNFIIIKKYDEDFLKKQIKEINLILKKSFFCMPFFKKILPIFSAYHFGSLKIKMKNNKFCTISKIGELSLYKNLYLIDGSVLKSIPSGPFTIQLMFNAKVIADKLYG